MKLKVKTKEYKNSARISRNRKQQPSSAPAPVPAVAGLTAGVGDNAASESADCITEIVAKIDVGFGNQLFIRGQGDGLTWEKGKPLVCRDASTWVWSTDRASQKLVFKLLLNDQVWAQGQDIVLEAGAKVQTIPSFQ